MQLIYESPDNAVRAYAGDCIELMHSLQPGTLDMVFADPPYNLGVDYGEGICDKMPEREYRRWTYRWLKAAVQCLRPGGTLFLMIGADHQAMAERTALAAGLRIQQRLVWTYTFGQNQRSRYTPGHVPMFWLVKPGGEPIFDREHILVPSWRMQNKDKRCADTRGKTPSSVWEFPRLVGTAKERVGWHPAQLPHALVRRAVLAHTRLGDTVLCPFHGSGTEMRACLATGRRYIGIDRNADYVRRSVTGLAGALFPEAAA